MLHWLDSGGLEIIYRTNNCQLFNVMVIDGRKVGIDLGGFEVRVAEPFANFVERYPFLGQARSKGVAELMPAHPATFA